MTGVIDTVLDQLDQLPLWAVLAAVCLVMALETTMLVGVVVPGDVVVLFAASTATTPLELGLLVVAVTLGSLAGETLGFGLGRRWGGRLRTSRAGRRLGDERWDRAAAFLQQRGGRAVFLARYLAAVHAITPIVAGTMGMRYRRFVGWCAAGGLTWSALYVAIGAAAGASYREYADSLGTATSVAVGGLVGAGVFVAAMTLRNRGVLRRLPGLSLPVPSPRGRRRWPLPVLVATIVAFGAYHLLDYPAGPPIVAVVVAVWSAANAGHLVPALAAGGLVTGSGTAYRWLVEGDDVVGVDTALGAVLLMTVALMGDAARARRAGIEHAADPTPVQPSPDPAMAGSGTGSS